jgi:hypothetical protein
VKKVLLLVVAAVGVAAISKKLRDQKAEKALWSEATDTPQ